MKVCFPTRVQITQILYLADLLEMCQFKGFWESIHAQADLIKTVAGFEDSIRRFVNVNYESRWLEYKGNILFAGLCVT